MKNKIYINIVRLVIIGLILLVFVSPAGVSRIDLYTDSADYTGGGDFTISSDDSLFLNATEVRIPYELNHDGDIDTRLQFLSCIINLIAGNQIFWTLNGLSSPQIATFNNLSSNMDLEMKGDHDDNVFFLDASTDRIGIGTDTPSELLSIAGNLDMLTNKIVNANLTDYAGDNVDWNGDTFQFDVNLTGTTYLPDNVDLLTGALDSGDLGSLQGLQDGDEYNVSEVPGIPGLNVIVNFSNVTSFDRIIYREVYDGGAGHTIHVGLWDYTDSSYEEEYGEITDMTDFATSTELVYDSPNHIDDGNVSVRFYHDDAGIPSHDFQIDAVFLLDGDIVGSLNNDHDAQSNRNNKSNHPWAFPTDASRDITGTLNLVAPRPMLTMQDTTARAKNGIIAYINDSNGNQLMNFSYSDTASMDIELRFNDISKTKIGFPDNNYYAMMNPYGEYWLGNQADPTSYLNYYGGSNINIGRAANPQNVDVWASDFDIIGNLDVSLGLTSATLNTGHGANELYPMDQPVLQSSDVTFNDVTTDGEINGDKHWITISFSRSNVITAGGSLYMFSDETQLSAAKGHVMLNTGSITGVSIMYDVTAQAGEYDLELRLSINGVNVWANDLSETTADEKTAYFTQARGADSFSAGDDVTAYLYNNGSDGSSVTVNQILILFEVITD